MEFGTPKYFQNGRHFQYIQDGRQLIFKLVNTKLLCQLLANLIGIITFSLSQYLYLQIPHITICQTELINMKLLKQNGNELEKTHM